MSDHGAADPALTYARRVGQRLRAIRRQKGLSLQDVEAASEHEFKASVLGAYERGERIISVPRLQRLAGYYEVPVDQLLPANPDADRGGGQGRSGGGAAGGGRPGSATDSDHQSRSSSDRGNEKITFDLTRFREVDDPELEMVRHYLNSIQVMRQDFNGRMLTVRRDDIRAIAGMFGTDAGALVERLEALELRLTP